MFSPFTSCSNEQTGHFILPLYDLGIFSFVAHCAHLNFIFFSEIVGFSFVFSRTSFSSNLSIKTFFVPETGKFFDFNFSFNSATVKSLYFENGFEMFTRPKS